MFIPLFIIKNKLNNLYNNYKNKLNNLYNYYKNDNELFSYILSFCHSSVITVGATIIIHKNDYEYLNILKFISYTYLLLDSIQLYLFDFFSNIRNIYLFHHLIFLLSWSLSNYDSEIYCKLLLAESSVIPLNLKFI